MTVSSSTDPSSTDPSVILAWHFSNETLRNNIPIPKIGEVFTIPPPIIMCRRGCHASRRIIDALQYAPGCNLHRVILWGNISEGKDKLVASNRVILWSINAKKLLSSAARKFALRVIHLWKPDQITLDYLNTGKEALRADAWADARASAQADAQANWASVWASARISDCTSPQTSAWASDCTSAQTSAWASAQASARASARAGGKTSAMAEMESILQELVQQEREKHDTK